MPFPIMRAPMRCAATPRCSVAAPCMGAPCVKASPPIAARVLRFRTVA
jgi:hypothetical protein